MLHLVNRSLIKLSGADVRNYLQGLISNDVNKLTQQNALYAAMMTAQGKYLFDFILYERDGAILLDCASVRMADLVKRLSMYKLRSQVEIIPMPELKIYGDHKRGIDDPRSPKLGKRLVTAENLVDDESFEEYERRRIMLGVPGSEDLIPDKSFILQNHFELFNGVDFNKGCYIGQEVVARTKYKGVITRQLYRVEGDGNLPPFGSEIKSGGKTIGEMRSVIGDIGLAQCEVEEVLPERGYEAAGVKIKLNPVN